MFFAFLLIVVVVFLGAVLIQWIAQHESYVLVAVGQTSVEMSLWLAVLLLLAAVLTFWITRLIIRGTFKGIGGRLVRFLRSGDRKADLRVNRGMALYFEGQWRTSLGLLEKVLSRTPQPVVTWIAASRSAQRLGDTQRAGELLDQAEESNPDARNLFQLEKARLLLDSRKDREAVEILEKMQAKGAKSPALYLQLQAAYRRLNEWSKLEPLLPELRRHQSLGHQGLSELGLATYSHLLSAESASEGADGLKSRWLRVPQEFRENASLIDQYASLLVEKGNSEEADSLLIKSLEKHWDDRLVRRFGLYQGKGIKRRLQKAENWLKSHDSDITLLMTLGRLAAMNELWGKARTYFEASCRLEETQECCAELARLLHFMGDSEGSASYGRKALAQVVDDLPSIAMNKSAGSISAAS